MQSHTGHTHEALTS